MQGITSKNLCNKDRRYPLLLRGRHDGCVQVKSVRMLLQYPSSSRLSISRCFPFMFHCSAMLILPPSSNFGRMLCNCVCHEESKR